MSSKNTKFNTVIISNFSSGFSDVLFAPILLNYMVVAGVSNWIIALTTILEYIPRIFSPLLVKMIENKKNISIIRFSTLGRFLCYIAISLLTITLSNGNSNYAAIIIILVINLFSDILGVFYFLNQTVVNKNNFEENDLGKLTNALFITSNLGIFFAYMISPILNNLFSMSTVSMLNALLFLIPISQTFFIKNKEISQENEKIKFRYLLTGNNKILFAISLTFCLNLMIGNPNFIITQYSSRFNLDTTLSLSIFSLSYLLGSLIPSTIFSFKKNILNFIESIYFSYTSLIFLFLSFLYMRTTLSVIIYVIMGISIGFLQPNLNKLIYDNSNEDNVSYYFSINSLVNSLGTILSPFIIQSILSITSYKNTVLFVCLYYLALLIFISFLKLKSYYKNKVSAK